MQVGDDDPGVHGVDANALGREIKRRDARELVDRRLAYAIGGDAWKRARTGDTRDVDDRAIARDERGRGFTDELKWRADTLTRMQKKSQPCTQLA